MTLQPGNVGACALIPVAIKANESLRKNARVRDGVAWESIRAAAGPLPRCFPR